MRTALVVVETTDTGEPFERWIERNLPYGQARRAVILAETGNGHDIAVHRDVEYSDADMNAVRQAVVVGRDLLDPRPAPEPNSGAVDDTVLTTLNLINSTLSALASRVEAIEHRAA